MSKICMIATNRAPFNSRIFYREAKSLEKAGHDVTVIGQMDLKMNKVADGIRVVGVEKGVGINSYPLLWRRLLKEASNVNATIYHCHEPDSLLIAIYLKIFKRKKIVYDVPEYYIDVIPLSTPQRKIFLGFMLYLFEPLVCRYVNAIITADEVITKRYEKFNQNVLTLYNFPPFDIFKPSGNGDIKKKNNNYFVIVYVGGLSEERGVFGLIKAVHKVSEIYPLIKLLLLGNFSKKDFENKCSRYIRSNKLDRNVDFGGFVPHDEIQKHIYVSDVGAVLLMPIPKFYKNIPMKQFEYMICGKPVIGSNLPTISRYIGSANCGILVDPTNIDEIADAIIYLIEHPEEAKRMGENGRRAVKEKYNWGKMEERLLNFYKVIEGDQY
jgi:glycosyltransferase involved in cell wall biosynthesis